MYAKIVSGTVERFPYTLRDLLQDNPNTSFPKGMSDDMLETFGMYKVEVLSAPACDPATQKVTQDSSPELVDGSWVCGWQVLSKNAEELGAYQTESIVSARALRDNLLNESDWIVSRSYEEGNPVPADWTVYRQALRDITDQVNFPDNITWPTKP